MYLLGGGGGRVKLSGGIKKDFTLDWLDSDPPSKDAMSSAHNNSKQNNKNKKKWNLGKKVQN